VCVGFCWRRKACTDCMTSHHELRTYEEVIVPIKTRALPAKWIFTIKLHPDGTIAKFKVRFVIQGFRQQKGVDFNEIF
jgi:hypothetical protein